MRLRDRFAPAQGIKHGVEGWHVQSLSVETRFARPADAEAVDAQTRTRVCLVYLAVVDCCRFCSAHRCTHLFLRESLLLSASPATLLLLSSARPRRSFYW